MTSNYRIFYGGSTGDAPTYLQEVTTPWWCYTTPLNPIIAPVSIPSYNGDMVVLRDVIDRVASLEKLVALLVPALEHHQEFKELRAIYDEYQKKLEEVKEIVKVYEIMKRE